MIHHQSPDPINPGNLILDRNIPLPLLTDSPFAVDFPAERSKPDMDTLIDRIIVDNRIAVLIDSNGKILAVQDALTGCAAVFLYSNRDIQSAIRGAMNAWQSRMDF